MLRGRGAIGSAQKGGKGAVLKLCKSPVAGALVLLASALVTGFNPLQKWDAVASAKP